LLGYGEGVDYMDKPEKDDCDVDEYKEAAKRCHSSKKEGIR
jgi:hypothetical protein